VAQPLFSMHNQLPLVVYFLFRELAPGLLVNYYVLNLFYGGGRGSNGDSDYKHDHVWLKNLL